MFTFPTSPVSGTVYTINGKNFTWNGVGFLPSPVFQLKTLQSSLWVATDTTLSLSCDKDKDFTLADPGVIVPITTSVTISLVAPPSGFSAEYWFKFKAGTGFSFTWPSGYIAGLTNDTIVAGSIYEVDLKAGVYIVKKC